MSHDPSNEMPPRASRKPDRTWTLSLSRRTLWLVAAAFAVGLAIACLLMFAHRGDNDFYRADDNPANTATGQQFEPLPVPQSGTPDIAAGADGGQGAPVAAAPDADDATSPAPAISPDDTLPSAAPTAPDASMAPPAPMADVADAAPKPLSAPQPVYPPAAMREGIGGTTLLQVEVGVDGAPTRVQVVQSSRSRDLDRAAQAAVQQWRFRPAMRGGQPVPGKVLVPIAFNPG